MKKIVILSTETMHHKYFISRIVSEGIGIHAIFMESKNHFTPFPIERVFGEQEDDFEKENFLKSNSNNLARSIFTEVKSINDKLTIDRIKVIKPDFGVVFGTKKLSEEVIELFNDGLINVHRGITEKYKGLDSDLWAIYHGDYENIGVTIHRVSSNLDAGEIAFCEAMPLIGNMKIHQIRYYTTIISTRLVMESIYKYLQNNLTYREQNSYGRYYSFMPTDLKKIVQCKFNKYCQSL